MESPNPAEAKDGLEKMNKKNTDSEVPTNPMKKTSGHYEPSPKFERDLSSDDASKISIEVMEETKHKFSEPRPDDSQNRPLITYSNEDNSARGSFMNPDLLNPSHGTTRQATMKDTLTKNLGNFKQKQDAFSPYSKQTGTFPTSVRSHDNLQINGQLTIDLPTNPIPCFANDSSSQVSQNDIHIFMPHSSRGLEIGVGKKDSQFRKKFFSREFYEMSKSKISCMVVNSDCLFVGNSNGVILQIDIEGCQVTQEFGRKNSSSGVDKLVVNEDTLFASWECLDSLEREWHIMEFSIRTCTSLKLTTTQQKITALAISSDNKYLCVGLKGDP